MERDKAIAALAQGLGIPVARLETIATELEEACLVDDDWDAEACALLWLRWLASDALVNDFLPLVAWAEFGGILVQEHSASWRALGNDANETPYTTQWNNGLHLVGAIASHLRCATLGWGGRAGYPYLQSVSLSQIASGGLFAELYLRFVPPAVFAPVNCSLAYGDMPAWLGNEAPIAKRTLGGDSLLWLLVEMRRELSQGMNDPGFEFAASAMVPDDLVVDRMLATHMAGVNVTKH